MSNRSDGSTASYYQLPPGCTELQDLISYRNMNAQDGEIFRAIYRKGRASHSDELRDARKVLFYAQAEVKRLEALAAIPADFGQQNTIEPAVEMQDDSDRMLADLMQWHGLSTMAEAMSLLILNAHALGPEQSAPLLAVPRHTITIPHSVARQLYQQGAEQAGRLDRQEQ